MPSLKTSSFQSYEFAVMSCKMRYYQCHICSSHSYNPILTWPLWAFVKLAFFFLIGCCEMVSEAIFQAQNTTTNLCFSHALVTRFWFTSRLDTSIVYRRFQVPREPCERAIHAGQSELLLSIYVVLLYSKQRWSKMCSQNLHARSQVSAALLTSRHGTFMRAWICTDDMWASRLQAKGQPDLLHRSCLSKVHWLYSSCSKYWRWML